MSKVLGKGTAVEMYKKLEHTMRVDVDCMSDSNDEHHHQPYDVTDDSGEDETPDPDKIFGQPEYNKGDIVFSTEVDPAMFAKVSEKESL